MRGNGHLHIHILSLETLCFAINGVSSWNISSLHTIIWKAQWLSCTAGEAIVWIKINEPSVKKKSKKHCREFDWQVITGKCVELLLQFPYFHQICWQRKKNCYDWYLSCVFLDGNAISGRLLWCLFSILMSWIANYTFNFIWNVLSSICHGSSCKVTSVFCYLKSHRLYKFKT